MNSEGLSPLLSAKDDRSKPTKIDLLEGRL